MRCARHFLPVLALATIACDDPGGTSGLTSDVTVASETSQTGDVAGADTATAATDTFVAEQDTAVAVDTAREDTGAATEVAQDTWVAPDTMPTDTGAPDTVAPDTQSGCELACPEVGPGPLGVVITNNTSATPPVLDGVVGADPMAGLYALERVTVYTKGAFDGILITSATVADAGQTSGTARFVDDHWAFYLDLDLTFTAQTVLGPQGGGSRNEIQGGGCFTIDGNDILSDTSACADGWPTGTTPPTQAEFEFDDATGDFTLKIVLTKDFVLALIPAEYQAIAEGAIKGPITFVAVLEAAD